MITRLKRMLQQKNKIIFSFEFFFLMEEIIIYVNTTLNLGRLTAFIRENRMCRRCA